MYINRLNIPQNLLSWGYLSVPAIYHGRSWGWLSPCEGNSTSLLILSGLHHDFGTFFSGELAVALFKTLPKAFHAILRTWKRPLYYGRSPKVWDIIGIVDKGLYWGWVSPCAGLFLRWVRLNSVSLLILSGLHGYFGTFPMGIGYFHCFLALYSSACKKMWN